MIQKSTSLKNILKLTPACSCDACSHGCTIGSGFLAKGDKEKLAKFLKISEKELEEKYLEKVTLFNKEHFRPKLLRKGKPYGKCIFFDKKCSVHEAKPLQCKVAMGCKDYSEDLQVWFMLNHLIDIDDAESVRQYSQYLKSGGKLIPGGKLEELIPDKKLREKILSYEILR